MVGRAGMLKGRQAQFRSLHDVAGKHQCNNQSWLSSRPHSAHPRAAQTVPCYTKKPMFIGVLCLISSRFRESILY